MVVDDGTQAPLANEGRHLTTQSFSIPTPTCTHTCTYTHHTQPNPNPRFIAYRAPIWSSFLKGHAAGHNKNRAYIEQSQIKNLVFQLNNNIFHWLKYKTNMCCSTITCKVLLNQPHSKLGQHCTVRCSILTKPINRRCACLVLLCSTLIPMNKYAMHPLIQSDLPVQLYYS